jgi:hypothetical protein
VNGHRPSAIYRICTLLILLVAWGLLLLRLNQVPPGFQHDQTFSALDAMQIVDGHHPIYFPDNFGRGPLFMYSAAGVFQLAGGHYVWSVRFTAVMWAMLGLAMTIVLARRYLSEGASLFAVSLMAGSFWFLLAGRLGVESIALLPLATGMLYFLDRGLSEHSWTSLALAGILGGIANYTYLASRALYALPILMMAYSMLYLVARRPIAARQRRLAGKDFAGLLLAFVLMLAVSGPLLSYLRSQPTTFDGRLGQLSSGISAALQGDLGPFFANIWDTVRGILWRGSYALPYQYNVPGRPALQPVWAVCLLLGLGLAIARGRQRHEFALLAALAVSLAPSLLTGADALYMRAIATLPLLCILVARGLWALPASVQAIIRRLAPDMLPQTRAATLARLPLLQGAAVVGLLLWHFADGGVAYFGTWAQAERTQRIYNADFRAAAPVIDVQPAGEQIFMGTDRLLDLDSATYGFYEPKRTDVHWFEAADSPPVPAQGSALYLLPASAGLPPTFDALSEIVRDAFWIPAPSGQYNLMRGYRLYADDIASFLQRRGNRPLSDSLVYGDALRLDTASLQDQGDNGELLTSWTVMAPWPRQARPGYPPARPKFSISLTDDSGYTWSRADQPTTLPFTTWQPGQKLLEINHVPLPADLPPGRYGLRLAIYDDEQGALGVTQNQLRIASAPVITPAELDVRDRGTAPQPPLVVQAGQEGTGELRVLGKWETLDNLSVGLPTEAHLSWQAIQPIETADLRFRVRGRDANGVILWEQTSKPVESLPAVWPAGQVFRLGHRIEPQTPQTGTTEARLEICAQQADTVLACAQMGQPQVRNHSVLTALPVEPQHPYGADWSGQFTLAGYDWTQSSQTISLTLYWRKGNEAASGALKRFVHAVGADHETMIAQSDDEFQTDGIPAALWQPGEYVVDRIALPIPAASEVSQLYVGLYDPDTGKRLTVQLPSSVTAPDGRAPLLSN